MKEILLGDKDLVQKIKLDNKLVLESDGSRPDTFKISSSKKTLIKSIDGSIRVLNANHNYSGQAFEYAAAIVNGTALV